MSTMHQMYLDCCIQMVLPIPHTPPPLVLVDSYSLAILTTECVLVEKVRVLMVTTRPH